MRGRRFQNPTSKKIGRFGIFDVFAEKTRLPRRDMKKSRRILFPTAFFLLFSVGL